MSIFKKTRVIGFGLLWFFIALLPTSLLPLAEVMNDHRTFLPYSGLVIAMAGVASLLDGGLDDNLLAKYRPAARGAAPLRKRLRYVQRTRFGKTKKRSGTMSYSRVRATDEV